MTELTVADLYAAGLARHLELAEGLTEADGDRPAGACPGWTVRDVYAHLAGLQTDILDGRTDGAGTDPWTGRQVEERSGRTLADNVAEYREKGPALVEALAAFPIERVVIDQWTHEQDVRGALDRPGSRDVPVVGWATGLLMAGLDARVREGGRPAVRIQGSSGEWTVGEGAPAATVAADDFTLLRAFLGRRSPAQVAALATPGSDPAALDGLALFGPRPDELVE